MPARREGVPAALPPWKCGLSPRLSPIKSCFDSAVGGPRTAPVPTRQVGCRSGRDEKSKLMTAPPGWREAEARLREEQLQAWQQAKRERMEQDRAQKAASRPRFDPSPSKPMKDKTQGCSFGAAGTLLRAARVLPKHKERAAPPLEARGDCNDTRCGDNADRSDGDCADHAGTPSTKTGGDSEFLEMCLGGPDAMFEHDVDQQQAAGKENATQIYDDANKPLLCSTSQKLEEDGSDAELSVGSLHSDDVDLEDMFAFEPETLADLVRKGRSMPRLIAHLQASYADALEHRLCGRAAPTIEVHESGTSTPRPVLGNVSQHMTPEEVTPVASPRSNGEAVGHNLTTFAGHALVEAVRLAQRRSRRSAALRIRPSALKREHAAVKAAELYGRKSLANAQSISSEEIDLLHGALESVVKTVSRRHRRSLDKAVEVLECVADGTDEPLDEWAEEKVDATVDLIQGAMDEAIKRHRRSIAEAVYENEGAPATTAVSTGGASTLEACGSQCPSVIEDMTDSSIKARIHRAVSAAFSSRSTTAKRKLLL